MIDSFILLYFTETEFRDANDNDMVAENELLNAANAIEAAAKKLSALRPRAKARVRKLTLAHFMFFLFYSFNEMISHAY